MQAKRQERRNRTAARKREDILQAFIQICSMKGLMNTTMEDVAREAGFASGTLYNYFRSKGDLVQAVREWIWALFSNIVISAVPEGTPFPARFRFITRRLFELAESHRSAWMVLLSVPLQVGPNVEIENWVRALFDKHQQLYEDILRPGVAEGYFSESLLPEYAEYFHCLIDGIIIQWLLFDSTKSITSRSEGVVDFFLRGIES